MQSGQMTNGVQLEPAQDPGEPFDVITADGKPTGRVKSRAEVHRDGDWHRAFTSGCRDGRSRRAVSDTPAPLTP